MYFEQSYKTINESIFFIKSELKEGGVLVHCAAGVSRVHIF